MPSRRPLGIGFVGSGFITRFHIRSWTAVRGADIRGVWSPNRTSAESAAALANDLDVGDARAYESIAAMVEDDGVDAIWICGRNDHRVANMEEIAEAVRTGRGRLVGVACEKPLARNAAEALRMVELAREIEVLDGYLENQVFSPAVVRGRELAWERGARAAGRPYLARAAEEHSGPHNAWFWRGDLQGGGVLNDMMCHSIEAARFLLTDPDKPRSSLTPKRVNAQIHCLKWQRPEYAARLRQQYGDTVDYARRPAEDFARAMVEYEDEAGTPLVVEATTSWSYVGAGLRLTMELLGPEYSMRANSLDTDLELFFSRDPPRPSRRPARRCRAAHRRGSGREAERGDGTDAGPPERARGLRLRRREPAHGRELPPGQATQRDLRGRSGGHPSVDGRLHERRVGPDRRLPARRSPRVRARGRPRRMEPRPLNPARVRYLSTS